MPPVKKASVKVRLNPILTSLLFLQVAGYLMCPSDLAVSQKGSSTVDVTVDRRETSPFESTVGSDISALELLDFRTDNNSDSSKVTSDKSEALGTPLMLQGSAPSKTPVNCEEAWLGNVDTSLDLQKSEDIPTTDKNAIFAWFSSASTSVFNEIIKLKCGFSPTSSSYEKILLNIKNIKSFDNKKSYLLEQVKQLGASFPQDWADSYEIDQQWGHLIINAELKSFEELCQYIVLMLTLRLAKEEKEERVKHQFCGQAQCSISHYINTHKHLLGFSDKGPVMAGFTIPCSNQAVYQLIEENYSSQSLFKKHYDAYSFDWAGVLPDSYKNGHVILLIKKHICNSDKVLFILKFGGNFDFVLPGGYVDKVEGADLCTSAKLTAINEFGQEVCFCDQIQAALQGALLHSQPSSISVKYCGAENEKTHMFNISLPDEVDISFGTRRDSLESLAGIWLDEDQIKSLLQGNSIDVVTCPGSSCGGLVLTDVRQQNFTYKQNLQQALAFLSQS